MAQNATKEARSVPHRLSYCSESNHQILRLWSWGGFTSTIVQFVLLFGVITSVCTLTSIFFQHINFLFSQKKHVNPKKNISVQVFFSDPLWTSTGSGSPRATAHGRLGDQLQHTDLGGQDALLQGLPQQLLELGLATDVWGNRWLVLYSSMAFYYSCIWIYIYIKTQGGHTFYTALQDLDCQTKSNYAFKKNWNTPSESIFKDTHPYIPQGEPGQTQG